MYVPWINVLYIVITMKWNIHSLCMFQTCYMHTYLKVYVTSRPYTVPLDDILLNNDTTVAWAYEYSDQTAWALWICYHLLSVLVQMATPLHLLTQMARFLLSMSCFIESVVEMAQVLHCCFTREVTNLNGGVKICVLHQILHGNLIFINTPVERRHLVARIFAA